MKQFTVRNSVPAEEIQSYMEKWAQKRPNDVKINVIGKSGQYDIPCAVFTNSSVSDENKQIVMITAQHSGVEISGMTTVMSLGNYLAAGQGRTEEILKKLVVVLVPCPNMYTYSTQNPHNTFINEFGTCEYSQSFDSYGLRQPDKTPAAVAVKTLIDEYRPEMLIDVHGVVYQDQLVMPTINYSAWASNKMYNEALSAEIQSGATDAGFCAFDCDWLEQNIQADKKCDDPKILAKFRFTAEGRANSAIYAYIHYHTLAATIEVGVEAEGLARLVRALEIGCETAYAEYYSGYPTRTVVSPVGHNMLRAYGTTAEARRKSRVELWSKRERLITGIAYPEFPYISGVLISLHGDKTKEIAGNTMTVYDLADNMRSLPSCGDAGADRIREIMENKYASGYNGIRNVAGEPLEIENGLTVRVGVPYKDATIKSVTYNGHDLTEDETFGYTLVKCRNWTFVDMHIPADKLDSLVLALVDYDCNHPESGIIEF